LAMAVHGVSKFPQSAIRRRGPGMKWEYRDEMVMFKETKDGLISNLELLGARGSDEWELASSVPLIAPNRDGVAYGTVGVMLIFKRPAAG
jgi:hypothetical protein